MELSHTMPVYLTALSIGLLGSAHCIGMCGGITSALSLSLQGKSRWQITLMMLAYHIGRIGSYALAGFILGSIGWYLGDLSRSVHTALRWFAGFMLVAMGLYITGWWRGLIRLEQLGGRLWKHIQPRANRLMPVCSLPNALALGSLWGWLPCGMVYSTLIWSASQGNALQSALLMGTFGLGTLPSVFLTGLFARQLTGLIQSAITRNLAGLLMVLFGIWAMPGPHQKWIMSLLTLAGHSM
ncbi:sulfite exporter TauE/SafE family protein [Endozoicomonas montiporae]|nr:sulfite exporter TauE/SafE family protein [Endozoicomonas montiporae]AMO57308.1 cytochrome c biogenesis transmembrane region family protein [Endozoicomonas montiporae CL-33]